MPSWKRLISRRSNGRRRASAPLADSNENSPIAFSSVEQPQQTTATDSGVATAGARRGERQTEDGQGSGVQSSQSQNRAYGGSASSSRGRIHTVASPHVGSVPPVVFGAEELPIVPVSGSRHAQHEVSQPRQVQALDTTGEQSPNDAGMQNRSALNAGTGSGDVGQITAIETGDFVAEELPFERVATDGEIIPEIASEEQQRLPRRNRASSKRSRNNMVKKRNLPTSREQPFECVSNEDGFVEQEASERQKRLIQTQRAPPSIKAREKKSRQMSLPPPAAQAGAAVDGEELPFETVENDGDNDSEEAQQLKNEHDHVPEEVTTDGAGMDFNAEVFPFESVTNEGGHVPEEASERQQLMQQGQRASSTSKMSQRGKRKKGGYSKTTAGTIERVFDAEELSFEPVAGEREQVPEEASEQQQLPWQQSRYSARKQALKGRKQAGLAAPANEVCRGFEAEEMVFAPIEGEDGQVPEEAGEYAQHHQRNLSRRRLGSKQQQGPSSARRIRTGSSQEGADAGFDAEELEFRPIGEDEGGQVPLEAAEARQRRRRRQMKQPSVEGQNFEILPPSQGRNVPESIHEEGEQFLSSDEQSLDLASLEHPVVGAFRVPGSRSNLDLDIEEGDFDEEDMGEVSLRVDGSLEDEIQADVTQAISARVQDHVRVEENAVVEVIEETDNTSKRVFFCRLFLILGFFFAACAVLIPITLLLVNSRDQPEPRRTVAPEVTMSPSMSQSPTSAPTFSPTGTPWELIMSDPLEATDGSIVSTSVDFVEDIVAVGSVARAGHVKLFQFDAGQIWPLEEIFIDLSSDEGNPIDIFVKIANGGKILAVSIPFADGSGRVYIYRQESLDGKWTPTVRLTDVDPSFGQLMDISEGGEKLVVATRSEVKVYDLTEDPPFQLGQGLPLPNRNTLPREVSISRTLLGIGQFRDSQRGEDELPCIGTGLDTICKDGPAVAFYEFDGTEWISAVSTRNENTLERSGPFHALGTNDTVVSVTAGRDQVRVWKLNSFVGNFAWLGSNAIPLGHKLEPNETMNLFLLQDRHFAMAWGGRAAVFDLISGTWEQRGATIPLESSGVPTVALSGDSGQLLVVTVDGDDTSAGGSFQFLVLP